MNMTISAVLRAQAHPARPAADLAGAVPAVSRSATCPIEPPSVSPLSSRPSATKMTKNRGEGATEFSSGRVAVMLTVDTAGTAGIGVSPDLQGQPDGIRAFGASRRLSALAGQVLDELAAGRRSPLMGGAVGFVAVELHRDPRRPPRIELWSVLEVEVEVGFRGVS